MSVNIESVEETTVVIRIDFQLVGILIRERPADVVVAPDVVDPVTPVVIREVMIPLEGMLKHVDIARGECLPVQRHLEGIIRKMAFFRIDIADGVLRMRYGFRL